MLYGQPKLFMSLNKIWALDCRKKVPPFYHQGDKDGTTILLCRRCASHWRFNNLLRVNHKNAEQISIKQVEYQDNNVERENVLMPDYIL